MGLGPLAEIASDAGHDVSGSDIQTSPTFLQLQKAGFDVSLDHSGGHIATVHAKRPIDWLVYTAALPEQHPELAFAESHHIRVSKRDEFMQKIIKDSHQKLIAVAGTHGKTTTTAMIVWLFKQLGLPVSYLVGAPMSWAPSGAFDKTSQYFIYECDEFDRNFLQFQPYLAAITSLDYDHPDTYPTPESYAQAFDQFKTQSQSVILWEQVDPQRVRLPGAHNRSNGAVAARVVSQLTGTPLATASRLLITFPGTSRRFEKLADNLYSDYAHHPAEIAATLELARELSEHVVVVYQPHQNTRQHQLVYDHCFDHAEKVYWLPTYLSREDPSLPVLTASQLTSKLDLKKIIEAKLDDVLWHHILDERKAGKLVIIMGAGSIDGWARHQLARLS